MAADMTYAQALTDAKGLIVQQSNRIKSDAEKIKAQSHEIGAQTTTIDAMSRELDTLRPLPQQLAEMTVAKEQVEAVVGRQRVHIDALESAAQEQQHVIETQNRKLSDLETMVATLRDQLPTEADDAALAGMASLLSAMRINKKSEQADTAVRQAA